MDLLGHWFFDLGRGDAHRRMASAETWAGRNESKSSFSLLFDLKGKQGAASTQRLVPARAPCSPENERS
jgi:hypothetical protein